jgi:hypothetical protein
MTNWPVRVLLLGQEGTAPFFEAGKILSQLSLLWKFEYTTFSYPGYTDLTSTHSFTHAVITYAPKDETYEKWTLDIIDFEKIGHVLLIDNSPKSYGMKMSNCFGVQGIESVSLGNKAKLKRLADDPVLMYIERKMMFHGATSERFGKIMTTLSKPLIGNKDGDCFMSLLITEQIKSYCFSLPIWQFGVPTFPSLFYIFRNFLFFAIGIGHFSLDSLVSLRIDDYPFTSQQFLTAGGAADAHVNQQIDDLCKWSKEFKAPLDFMINSHILDKNKKLTPVSETLPKSCSRLRDYYKRNVIDIHAHGRSHIDEEKFYRTGEISPLEFTSLSEEETKRHLSDNITILKQYFDKTAMGFVAPSWGYNGSITKKICAKYFSFVLDSSRNFRSSNDAFCSGHVDENGLLHILETWHLGRDRANYADKALWHAFLDNGIPIHMMVHEPYIYDPLPTSQTNRFLAIMLCLFILPFFALIWPSDIFRTLTNTSFKLRWGRLNLFRRILVKLPYFKNASVRHLLDTGKNINANWVSLEQLAEYLREYSGLEMRDYKKLENKHQLFFITNHQMEKPVIVRFPFVVNFAELDGTRLYHVKGKRCVSFSPLQKGKHTLIVGAA